MYIRVILYRRGNDDLIFQLNHHSDAELALTESNMLDAQCSLTWAYLALINGIRKNANNFEQCARIAIEVS